MVFWQTTLFSLWGRPSWRRHLRCYRRERLLLQPQKRKEYVGFGQCGNCRKFILRLIRSPNRLFPRGVEGRNFRVSQLLSQTLLSRLKIVTYAKPEARRNAGVIVALPKLPITRRFLRPRSWLSPSAPRAVCHAEQTTKRYLERDTSNAVARRRRRGHIAYVLLAEERESSISAGNPTPWQ